MFGVLFDYLLQLSLPEALGSHCLLSIRFAYEAVVRVFRWHFILLVDDFIDYLVKLRI